MELRAEIGWERGISLIQSILTVEFPGLSTQRSRLLLSWFSTFNILKYQKEKRKLCSQFGFFFKGIKLARTYLFPLTATSCKNVSSGWEN